MAAGGEFLTRVFAEFRSEMEKHYEMYMTAHEQYISTGLSSAHFTAGFGKISNIVELEGNPKYVWVAPKGRWFIHMMRYVRVLDATQTSYTYIMYDNYGCTYRRMVIHTNSGRMQNFTPLTGGNIAEQLAAADAVAAKEGMQPLPNALISFIKGLPTDGAQAVPAITTGSLSQLMQHYYSSFVSMVSREKLVADVEKKDVENAQLKAELATTKKRSDDTWSELSAKIKEVNAIVRNISEKNDHISVLQTSIAEKNAELGALRARIAELEAAAAPAPEAATTAEEYLHVDDAVHEPEPVAAADIPSLEAVSEPAATDIPSLEAVSEPAATDIPSLEAVFDAMSTDYIEKS